MAVTAKQVQVSYKALHVGGGRMSDPRGHAGKGGRKHG